MAGRFKIRDPFKWLLPVIVGTLMFLLYVPIYLAYILHFSSYSGNYIRSNVIDKDINWKEHEAMQSVRVLFNKEVLGVLNNTTRASNLDPMSVESLRKRNRYVSWNHYGSSKKGQKNHMVPSFGHGTWRQGDHVFNVTLDKLYERSLRQDRRFTRVYQLMNDDTIHEFEKAAIQRSRSVDSVALGNYTIWRKEYREGKNFEDMLLLMKDQIIMARVYTTLAKMTDNLALHDELEAQLEKLAVMEEEESTDIDQKQRRVLDSIRDMGQVLGRASEQLYECKFVTNKLRAMLQTVEEELENTQTHTTFLTQLVSKSLTDAIHCLSLRLNLEYYLLPAHMRKFPREENLENPKLYHYALFSDNVLAASVVVNSTVMNAKDSSRHVFHLVTDKLNIGAMSMWFLLNPPGDATIQVQKFEDFTWLNSSNSPVLRQLETEAMKKFYFKTARFESAESGSENLKYRYPKYMSMLNHLRFYLPRMYPKLEKILFLDDDVVVQKDLSPLWLVDLKGKVNGAVETCGVTFHRLDTYLNFSDDRISERFDPKGCGWAYGMNIFDLKEWKKNNITDTYHFWQDLNENRTLWKLGTLPPGLMTFYNLTQPFESKWHLLRLGYDKEITAKKIERSAVIHFNGHMKPWTELGIPNYQPYWSKYINFDHPYIFSCRLFE